jgi:hypothetical protein
MSQDGGPRIISKYIEGVRAKADVSESTPFTIEDLTNASGWNIDGTNGRLYWQGYMDLSGYRPDDMILSPRAVQIQYGNAWGGEGASMGATKPSVISQIAITTDKIDDISFGNSGPFEPLAGFIGDNSEMDQVIYGCTEAWGPAANGVLLSNYQKLEYGDGVPIVGPRVYITIRVQLIAAVSGGSATDSFWAIPPMRIVIAGEAAEVPEFQLLHLMARQYDLQQTPDVDV